MTITTSLSQEIISNTRDFLDQHRTKELLRFMTCGSVDDGKSTLIGRLLIETGSVYDDQIAALQRDSDTNPTPQFYRLLAWCPPRDFGREQDGPRWLRPRYFREHLQ